MSKINVAFFINDITSGGGTESVTCMISNLLTQADDYNITIITLNEAYGAIKFPVSNQVRVVKIHKDPKYGISQFASVCIKLHNYIKRLQIDVLIDVDGILDLYSIPARAFTRTKLISWEHFNYHFNPDVPYRKLSRQLAGFFANAIVTLTETDKEFYIENLKFKRARILSIPNPMDSDATQNHNLNSTTIVSAGRLTYQKGFDILIDVAQKVLPQHPDWQWIVLGEGEDHKQLEQKTQQLGLSNQLHFPGRTNTMDSHFSQAAFFVMTSRFEGLPMVLLEAKAFRLPIVSFDCETGPTEMVEDGVNGYLIPPFDITAMATKINSLIDSKNDRELFSKHATENMDRYNAQSVLASWSKLLGSIVK